ncbi:hypothetical protein ACH4T9_06870 [Micromonospora sp. NPDC020750]|uniref:hypothetical protein n=1 Tax=unclassified Micromonospora TaxID=2617518 RepID=UPI00379D0B6D
MAEMENFGFKFLGFQKSTGIPSFAAWMVASCRPNEGRRDRIVALADPDQVSKANADWYSLSEESGLFADRRFLVSLEVPLMAPEGGDEEVGELVWGLVELAEEWDVMGVGAASGVLGWGFGCPGFAMSSVSGSVFVQGTVWQDSIGIAVLPSPFQIPSLREVVRRNVGKSYRTTAENEDAMAWLARGAWLDD